MSGGGLAGAPGAGLPANLQRPEVLAALEVTRAKFAAQQAAAAAAAAQQPNGVAASASVPYRQQHQQPSQPQPSTGLPARPAGATALLGATRTNPMFGEAALFSPDKKSDREYTPVLADAIRAPTLDALAPDAGLPPVGDLFAATPQLPAYLPKGKDGAPALLGAPALPPWDGRRAFLTGRFVWDEAQERVQQGGAAAGRPAVLETYPLHVQEALREWAARWVGPARLFVLVLVPPPAGLAAASNALFVAAAAAPAVVDDLLSAFLGLSGTYVRAKQLEAPGGARLGYEVVAARGSLEPALQEMATRMLPIWWVQGRACVGT